MEEPTGEPTVVPEDEGHVGLFKYPVDDKGVLLRHGNHFSQHVRQPDRVDEVEVVETTQVVVVVEEDTVVMEKLGSYGGSKEQTIINSHV